MLKFLALMLLSTVALANNTVYTTDMKAHVLTVSYGCEVNAFHLVPLDEANSVLDVTCEEQAHEKLDTPTPTPRYTPMGYVRVMFQGKEFISRDCNLFFVYGRDGNTTYYFQCF